jgi:hypothetical protein
MTRTLGERLERELREFEANPTEGIQTVFPDHSSIVL